MAERKPRSFNALKIVNELRTKQGLSKIGAKPKTIKISPADKTAILAKIISDKFPELLDGKTEVYNESLNGRIEAEYKKVEGEIKSGKIKTVDFLGVDSVAPIKTVAKAPGKKQGLKK